MRCTAVAAFLLCAAAAVARTAADKASEELGFTGLQSCADCDSMSEYVKDEGLVADCRKCCVKAEEDTIKYTSAILEVCPYRLNGLPAIKDFIDNHSTQYGKALRVSRTMGAYPKFILQQELGATKSVRIDQWKVEAMHEFLQSRLELGNTKKKAAMALS